MPAKLAPIALQLYSVRDALAKDYVGVMRRIADMGYAGVEPAGYPGTTPKKAGKIYRDLGLQVPSTHTGLPLGKARNAVLDEMAAIGSKRIISGFWKDAFESGDAIKRTADTYNRAAREAKKAGLTLGMHNHWWEFLAVDGRRADQILLDHLDPSVFLEVDTYWVKMAGADPVAVVRELGKRAPLLHIKDGPLKENRPMTAVGDGRMDFPAIVRAGGTRTKWLIVELDDCATDMMEAVEKSVRYLAAKKLGRKRGK
jgi:sugar phosphate isomerase/epimerase